MSKRTNPITEASVTCGFYNSLNGDRTYDTLQLSSIFDGIIGNGIFASIGDCFVVKAGSGNTVNVGTGKAWFNRTWTLNDAILPVDCGDSEVLLNRIDAIVIEVDTREAVRDNFIKVIKGTPATYPAKPELNTVSGVYQYPLCYIYRAAGSTSIVDDDITPMIGTETTPFVSGILEVISFDKVLGKWKAELDTFTANEKADLAAFMSGQEDEFKEWFRQMKVLMNDVIAETKAWTEAQQSTILQWFETIKDQLSEDAAANLQLQIDKEEIKRLLLVGFVDGVKTFSEDGSTITSTDSDGRRIVKTFSDNFTTCVTMLYSAKGALMGVLNKTFSEDGSTIESEYIII